MRLSCLQQRAIAWPSSTEEDVAFARLPLPRKLPGPAHEPASRAMAGMRPHAQSLPIPGPRREPPCTATDSMASPAFFCPSATGTLSYQQGLSSGGSALPALNAQRDRAPQCWRQDAPAEWPIRGTNSQCSSLETPALNQGSAEAGMQSCEWPAHQSGPLPWESAQRGTHCYFTPASSYGAVGSMQAEGTTVSSWQGPPHCAQGLSPPLSSLAQCSSSGRQNPHALPIMSTLGTCSSGIWPSNQQVSLGSDAQQHSLAFTLPSHTASLPSETSLGRQFFPPQPEGHVNIGQATGVPFIRAGGAQESFLQAPQISSWQPADLQPHPQWQGAQQQIPGSFQIPGPIGPPERHLPLQHWPAPSHSTRQTQGNAVPPSVGLADQASPFIPPAAAPGSGGSESWEAPMGQSNWATVSCTTSTGAQALNWPSQREENQWEAPFQPTGFAPGSGTAHQPHVVVPQATEEPARRGYSLGTQSFFPETSARTSPNPAAAGVAARTQDALPVFPMRNGTPLQFYRWTREVRRRSTCLEPSRHRPHRFSVHARSATASAAPGISRLLLWRSSKRSLCA